VRLAIISDVHSNLEALRAALEEIDRRGCDAIYCLGDVVGYGAEASDCVDIVRERCAGVVLGNHDDAVATGRGLEYLPKDGQEAVSQNRAQLSDEQIAYLAGLPLRLDVDGCTFVHATPEAPELWRRLDSFVLAKAQFNHFEGTACFVGHTHTPAIMADRLGVLRVRPGNRYLINVGSVGQPRDSNPQLCFTIFDTEAVTCDFVRVPYNVELTVRKILDAGLPKGLANRLKVGR
jgi:diadenosine tetraphosphatase ApaH/serine/threonine PP2A family protein phosphatase